MVLQSSTHHAEQRPKRSRSDRLKSRACDRCRLRKSKCDGKYPCRTCVDNKAPCAFTAKRKSEARRELLRLSDSMDRALHVLYRTTITHGCFPGILPAASAVKPTTQDILMALGLPTGSADLNTSPSLTASSLPEMSSLPKDVAVSIDHDQPLPTQQKPKRRRVSFANPADAITYYETSDTLFGHGLPTRPLGMQSQHEFSSYSSQATTLSGSGSQNMQELEAPVDMRTQFAIAVGDTLPKIQTPMLQSDPTTVVDAGLTDPFMDLSQCSQHPLDPLTQNQAIQMDPIPLPPCFQQTPYA